jgi:hypothetical protein
VRPPVGALLGFLPFRACSTTVPGSVSRVDTRGRDKPCTSCASGHPAVAVACRDPDTDAWTREPRIRRSAASIERRTSPSSGNPAQRALMRARMRQSPAWPAPPFTASPTERLARAPVQAAPRASLPLAARSPEGAGCWTSKTQLLEPSTGSHPLRGRPASTPLTERALVPRCRVDALATGFRHPRWLRPALREERVRGGSPCRQVDRLSWVFVPRRTDSPVRAIVGAELIRPSDRSPTDASPGVRRPVTRTPRSAPHHSRLAP